jgi:hypothetical protein
VGIEIATTLDSPFTVQLWCADQATKPIGFINNKILGKKKAFNCFKNEEAPHSRKLVAHEGGTSSHSLRPVTQPAVAV